jgi:hypothetical protein
MCVRWAGMKDEVKDRVEMANQVFTTIFFLEAAFKITAFGCRYFKHNYNVFDFVIVMSSLVFIVLERSAGVNLGTTGEVFRCIRIFRL